jgi:hypothetical protein
VCGQRAYLFEFGGPTVDTHYFVDGDGNQGRHRISRCKLGEASMAEKVSQEWQNILLESGLLIYRIEQRRASGKHVGSRNDEIHVDLFPKGPPVIPTFRLCCDLVFDALHGSRKPCLFFGQLFQVLDPGVDLGSLLRICRHLRTQTGDDLLQEPFAHHDQGQHQDGSEPADFEKKDQPISHHRIIRRCFQLWLSRLTEPFEVHIGRASAETEEQGDPVAKLIAERRQLLHVPFIAFGIGGLFTSMTTKFTSVPRRWMMMSGNTVLA